MHDDRHDNTFADDDALDFIPLARIRRKLVFGRQFW